MATNELSSVLLQSIEGESVTPEQANSTGLRPDNATTRYQPPPTEAEKQKEREELNSEDVNKVTKFLNDSANLFNVSLAFRIEDSINRIVVSVYNRDTDEVIRQIPAEEVIQLAERLNEMVGVLFNETA